MPENVANDKLVVELNAPFVFVNAAQAREKAIEVLNNANKGIEPTAQKGINKPKTLQEFIEKEYKPWVLSNHKRGEETIAGLTRCFKKLFPKPLT